MKVSRAVAAALVVVTMCLSGLVRAADVLDQVPANSMVVIKIRSIKTTSQKIAELAQALGVAEFSPEMADPLGSFQKEHKMEKGIDPAGDVAITFLDPGKEEAMNEKSIIALVPVTTYKEFVSNFADAKADGDITTATMPDGETAYMANWGSYAAISPNKDLLAKKPEGIKVDGLAGRELQAKDAIVYVNFELVKKIVGPKMESGREKFITQVEKGMAQNPNANPKSTAIVKVMMNRLIDAAQVIVNDTHNATWGLQITKAGINATVLTDFIPESKCAKIMARSKNTSDPLMAGLPDTKYLFYGGSFQDPKLATQTWEELTTPLKADFAPMGDDAKPIIEWMDSYKTLVGATTGASFGMVAPTGPLGVSGLVQVAMVYRGEAKTINSVQQKIFQTQQDMMKALGAQTGQVKTTFTANAKQVEGVQLNQMQTTFTLDPKTPQEAQAAQMVAFMYGPNGLNGYTGVVNDKAAIVVQGGNDELLKSIVVAGKANTDALSLKANIKAVDAELPKNRVGVVYVPVDTIASTILNYARQFGFPMQVQLPPDLPPIGITFGSEQTAFRADMHVPQQLIQSLVAAGMQVYMQMQGGGPGGAPGGPGEPGGL